MDLSKKLAEIARTPLLLVASDFDGTISPIAPEPGLARPDREAIVALYALAALPQTHVAVISGRSLRDLAAVSGLSEDIHLVGSHGGEFDPDFDRTLTPAQVELRDRLQSQLGHIAKSNDAFKVEGKPASMAFHYRSAESAAAARAVESIMAGPAILPGVYIKRGKKVIELGVVPTDKGKALVSLRHRLAATAAIFIGDDESDEDAFAVLRGPDVSVLVGEGPTRAEYTVANHSDAARLLATLAQLRDEWVKGSEAVPIEEHSILSDQRTVALVTPDARIVWFCVPRIDSAAIFAEIVGGPIAGFFRIGPANGSPPIRQHYMDDTFLLRTQWSGFCVTDYLDCSSGRPFQRAGRTDLIRVIEGNERIAIEFAPRLDFGREHTRLKIVPEGLHVEGCLDPIVLRAPGVTWCITEEGKHQRATAKLDLKDRLVLELRCGVFTSQELVTPELNRRTQTQRFWKVWADQLVIPSVAPDLVKRSALVLKALCYGPTGAISAAGTMSLPEHIGGVRNWDYRCCWLRDASMAAASLARLGTTGPGVRMLDWLLGILDRGEGPEWFRPVYTVTGGHVATEAEIPELTGYRGSRPVRVGNAAAQQLQLDVFGPIMELLELLAASGAALSTEHWRLTEAVMKAVAQRWKEPDHGIWEIRRPRQHHVHSKIMCWLAVDRALRLARGFSTHEPEEWLALRENIAKEILERGWNSFENTFTATYDGAGVDAALLHVGLSGLIPGTDPRFVATVNAVESALRNGPTVYRYLYDDGLPGREGGFHLCTAWLIQALILTGRRDRARELFDQFAALFGPTGLAPEEYCPRTRRSLGNHPQAYTHIGLIDSAVALSQGG